MARHHHGRHLGARRGGEKSGDGSPRVRSDMLVFGGFRGVCRCGRAGDAGAGLRFPDKSFDVAFLASVIGEVPDKSSCIRSLARVVKPGGRLVFVEGFPDPDRLNVRELQGLAESAGVTLLDTRGTRWQDPIRFVHRPDDA